MLKHSAVIEAWVLDTVVIYPFIVGVFTLSCPLSHSLSFFGSHFFTCEPQHDKTNNVAVRPANTQISLGIRPVWSVSSLSAWRKLGSFATHWAHSEYWPDWADAKADLSLRWAHSHFVGFFMSRLMYTLQWWSGHKHKKNSHVTDVSRIA